MVNVTGADHVGEDGLRHGAAADVTVANEKYFYHNLFFSFIFIKSVF